MDAGSSQMVTTTHDPAPNMERKKKRKDKKLQNESTGKEKEVNEEEKALRVQARALKAEAKKARKTEGQTYTPPEEQPWNWRPLTDSAVSNRPPVFTPDSRYFFLIVGSTVKIYSTATGQVISTLSSPASGSGSSSSTFGDAHTDEITAAFISPRNPFQLMTASLDGHIKTWDYLEAVLLTTIDVGEPITHMCAHETLPDYVFVATNPDKRLKKGTLNPNEKESSKVIRVNLKPTKVTENQAIKTPWEKLRVGKMRVTMGMGFSPSGEWLVAIGGTKAYVCPTKAVHSGWTKFVANELLTCLTFHPTEDYFATGDHKGQIRLWYCLDPTLMRSASDGGERRAKTTTLHWHAHAVSSITFSPNGAYLLSGGEEAVLVIWQLHSGKREFVPRVGAPISSVAVASYPSAEEEYLLVLSDASLVFIGSTTLKISRSFARIKHDPNFSSSGPAPLAVHTLTSTVILPSSHPSSLLAYSPSSSSLLSEIEVSPSNRVSRREEKPVDPSKVETAVISADGLWMATIDGREADGGFERESYLKIWQWDAASSTWNLNSRIDRPHGIHKVTALLFAVAPEHPFLVSTGEDGNVKVWRIRILAGKKREAEVFWVPRSTLGYRSQVPLTAACSPDGSLLAVAYGATVVIYEISTNEIRATLKAPETRNISYLAFVGSSGRYLAVSYWRGVVVWDLLTTAVLWQRVMPGSVYHLVPHPKEDSFVVFIYGEKNPSVRKFSISQSASVGRASLPFVLRTVAWYPFAGATGTQYSLIGITQDWSSVLLGDKISLPDEDGASAKTISQDNSPQRCNLFQDIFGVSSLDVNLIKSPAEPELPREDVSAAILKSSKIFNAPAYLLPPLHTLYNPLVDGLLRPRRKEKEPVPDEPEVEVEVEVEDEDVVMEGAEPSNVSDNLRQFSAEDMDDFVQLFSENSFSTAIKPTLPHKSSNGNGNSKTTTNGTHTLRNGTHHAGSSSSTPVNGRRHAPERVASTTKPKDASDFSPAVVGKKRKKSMG